MSRNDVPGQVEAGWKELRIERHHLGGCVAWIESRHSKGRKVTWFSERMLGVYAVERVARGDEDGIGGGGGAEVLGATSRSSSGVQVRPASRLCQTPPFSAPT